MNHFNKFTESKTQQEGHKAQNTKATVFSKPLQGRLKHRPSLLMQRGH